MKKSLVLRSLSVLLLVTMVLAMAACAKKPEAEPTPTIYQGMLDNPATYFTMNLSETIDAPRYLTAYTDRNGTTYVEYMGDVRKVSDEMSDSVMHSITMALHATSAKEMNGESIFAPGDANGSMFVEYQDTTMLTATYSGEIPQAFKDVYNAMEAYFALILADVPVYVPEPVVNGEVNPTTLEEIKKILAESGMAAVDTLQISEVAKDDAFAYVMGLSDDKGIVSGTSCSAMMMTTAYSLNIATVESEADIEAVRQDFQNSMDWRKWVCVAPESALIAQKDNMVLCLMGSGTMFQQTANGIEAAGWTEILNLDNPDF